MADAPTPRAPREGPRPWTGRPAAFYWLYTLLIVFGAGVPRLPLLRVVLSQVANGILLPFVLIFVLLLINDRELMGQYTNSRWYNVVSWITVGVMIALTLAMVIAQGRTP